MFKGDLDQMRTVAEMEEPEYEPRADSLRGGGALLRSMSRARSKRELREAKKIHEEHMEPIREGDQVEFDGIRRRKTVIGDINRPPTRAPTIAGTKTIHPPLGMSQFPTYDEDDDDNDSFHPGFFQRLRSRGKSTGSRGSANAPASNTVGMRSLPPLPTDGTSDTAYRPHDQHIQFAPLPEPPSSPSHSDSLRTPANMAKRQFSFQNPFGRNRPDSAGEGSAKRPTSRHIRKLSGDPDTAVTEEERLGLVQGDSNTLLPIQSRGSEEISQPVYSDWTTAPRTGSPGVSGSRAPPTHAEGIRRIDSEENPIDEKDIEKGAPRSNAFL